jgi:hypothetical protein
MKKLLLSTICCFSAASIFSQIPNSSFENWTSMGTYDVPNGWGTMNNTTTSSGVYTATKGSPGSPGNYYLKLTSKTVGANVVNGIAVSGQLDSVTMQPKSGFSFTQRPTGLTGKWQHMIFGSSQGSISITLTRWDAGMNVRIPVGSGRVTLSGMAMSWANFTVPITYVDGNNPDTCIIVLQASGNTPTNNDYLWVDNLAFSGIAAGIENNTSFINELKIYPNPSTEKITIDMNLKNSEKISLELLDITGKVILVKDAGMLKGESKQNLDVSGISNGSYFLRISSPSDCEVRKIVIE